MRLTDLIYLNPMPIEIPSSDMRTPVNGIGEIKLRVPAILGVGKAVSSKEKEWLYQELTSLLAAKIDLASVLDVLLSVCINKNLKRVLKELHLKVSSGVPLSSAIRVGRDFNDYEQSLIRIGEESGNLPSIFRQLAQHYRERMILRRTLKQALSYPAFVLVISGLVILFMMSVVVPMFADVFARSNAELPSLTKAVMVASQTFKYWFPGGITLGVLTALVLRLALKRKSNREVFERIVLLIPVAGAIVKSSWLSRFCQSMKLLIRSGVPIDRAIYFSASVNKSELMSNAIESVRLAVISGSSLKDALKETNFFDKSFVAKVGVAEEVNQLDGAFEQLAKQYSNDVAHRTSMIGSVLEPTTVLVISIFVGVVLIAMYLPMFKLSTTF